MALKIEVLGKKDLDRLARKCHEAARVGVKKNMDQGLQEAGEAVAHGVRDASDIYMPKHYEETFSSSLVTKVTVGRGAMRGVSLEARAFGRKGNPRKVEDFEAGRLRHPVYGRTRVLKGGGTMKNPWVWQRIRKGWFSEPARFAIPAAVRKLDRAAGRVADSIGNRP